MFDKNSSHDDTTEELDTKLNFNNSKIVYCSIGRPPAVQQQQMTSSFFILLPIFEVTEYQLNHSASPYIYKIAEETNEINKLA